MLSVAEFYANEPQGSQAYGAQRPDGRIHTGDDFSHSIHPGTVQVPSLTDGVVHSIQRDRPGLPNGYGNQVQIRLPDGSRWSYSHLHDIARLVVVGRKWDQGESVGTEGETGWTTGSCVHTERWSISGVRQDPYPQIRTILASLTGSGAKPFQPTNPTPAQQGDIEMRTIYNTERTDDENRRAAVGELTFQVQGPDASKRERRLWGEPIPVTEAEWNGVLATCNARRAMNGLHALKGVRGES